MNSEQFAYWLQGFVELCPETQPSPAQWQAIKDHLSTVFVKVTPPLGKPSPVPPTVPSMPPVAPLPYTPPRITDWPSTMHPVWRGSEITCGSPLETVIC